MVIAGLFLSFAVTGALANQSDTGVEPAMAKTNLPAIKSVVIRENGAASPAAKEEAQQCSGFRLSNKEVLGYLRNSAQVSEHDYQHTLDWSPCYASGDVFFKDGSSGVWGIQQLRAGSLKLSDGRTIYLYCPRCHAKGFPPAER
jgi:hypothetical protein